QSRGCDDEEMIATDGQIVDTLSGEDPFENCAAGQVHHGNTNAAYSNEGGLSACGYGTGRCAEGQVIELSSIARRCDVDHRQTRSALRDSHEIACARHGCRGLNRRYHG